MHEAANSIGRMAARGTTSTKARLVAWEDMSNEQREREIVKLWRIRRTVYTMLSDRGYLVAASELNQTLADFRRIMVPGTLEGFQHDNLMIIVGRKEDPATQTIVFFNGETQIGVQPLRRYSEKMRELSAQTCIIVYRGTTSGFVRHTLADYKETMQVFEEEELIVNITEHSLVPKHTVLTEEEKKQLLER